MIVLSDDDYVRLSLATLQTIRFKHLFSGLSKESIELPALQHDGLGEISGHTEWVSSIEPVISIGWDWRLAVVDRSIHYDRMPTIYSNLMLVGGSNDLGSAQTKKILGGVVDAFDWQRVVADYIANLGRHGGQSKGR
ncbi:MAG: DUF4902 domain-containing protein [Candidatus Sedimenticola sp. (ex Thyasira tokunagai)]